MKYMTKQVDELLGIEMMRCEAKKPLNFKKTKQQSFIINKTMQCNSSFELYKKW